MYYFPLHQHKLWMIPSFSNCQINTNTIFLHIHWAPYIITWYTTNLILNTSFNNFESVHFEIPQEISHIDYNTSREHDKAIRFIFETHPCNINTLELQYEPGRRASENFSYGSKPSVYTLLCSNTPSAI